VVYASPGDGDSLQLFQVKRRGAAKQSLGVRYQEGSDGSIVLTGDGAVDADLFALEKAKFWLLELLIDRGEMHTREIKATAVGEALPWRTVERALRELVDCGDLVRPKQGLYRVSAKAPENEVF
jgi:hypothetical protein